MSRATQSHDMILLQQQHINIGKLMEIKMKSFPFLKSSRLGCHRQKNKNHDCLFVAIIARADCSYTAPPILINVYFGAVSLQAAFVIL